ncbi:hypothetical protein CW304_02710 [Bacillus sp. UFRGS-B20]|nr:hypothetical protein CW304_02710 [Bacillus sp. UFRGS-B20]
MFYIQSLLNFRNEDPLIYKWLSHTFSGRNNPSNPCGMILVMDFSNHITSYPNKIFMTNHYPRSIPRFCTSFTSKLSRFILPPND